MARSTSYLNQGPVDAIFDCGYICHVFIKGVIRFYKAVETGKAIKPMGLRFLAVCISVFLISALPSEGRSEPSSQRTLFLESGAAGYPLADWADVFEDTGARLSISDISAPDFKERFMPLSHLPLTIQSTESNFWIRVSLTAGSGAQGPGELFDWVLYNWAPFMGMLELYMPVGEPGKYAGSFRKSVSGRDYLWEIQGRLFSPTMLRLDIPLGEPVTLYMCVSRSPSMAIRLSVESSASFQARSTRLMMSHAGFLGLLSGFMIYSLFMWVIARESNYLYAAVYMLLGFLAALNYRGPQFFVMSYGPMASDFIRRFSWVLASIVMLLITRRFFRVRELFPKIDTCLLLMIPLMLGPWVAVAVTGRPLPYFHLLRNAATDLSHVFVIGVAGLAWLKGFKPARFFLAGFLINSTAVIFSSLQLFGMIPYTPEHSVMIPNLLYSAAVIFFFLALADKINELRKEKNALLRSERRLKQLSHTDGLTGLFNKRYLNSKLKGDVEHARRLGRNLALVVIDIDHFKSFNDRFGHLEGDTILRLLGEIMKATVRDGDSACRYGGEEFVVIAPETDQQGAWLLAERIRLDFKEKTAGLDPSGRYACTLSAGVAEIRPSDTEQLIFKRADEALYTAKSSGRDRTLPLPSSPSVFNTVTGGHDVIKTC